MLLCCLSYCESKGSSRVCSHFDLLFSVLFFLDIVPSCWGLEWNEWSCIGGKSGCFDWNNYELWFKLVWKIKRERMIIWNRASRGPTNRRGEFQRVIIWECYWVSIWGCIQPSCNLLALHRNQYDIFCMAYVLCRNSLEKRPYSSVSNKDWSKYILTSYRMQCSMQESNLVGNIDWDQKVSLLWLDAFNLGTSS